MNRDVTPEQALIFTLSNANRLAVLALFDAVAEMLGPDTDELRMRFMRHLEGRASEPHPEARLLRDLAAQVQAERVSGTSPGNA